MCIQMWVQMALMSEIIIMIEAASAYVANNIRLSNLIPTLDLTVLDNAAGPRLYE